MGQKLHETDLFSLSNFLKGLKWLRFWRTHSVAWAFLLLNVRSVQTPERCQGGVILRCCLCLCLLRLGFLVLDFIHQPARIVGSGGMGRAEGGHDHVCVGGVGPAARQGQRDEAVLVLNANGLTVRKGDS